MPVTRNVVTHPHSGRGGKRFSLVYGGYERAATPKVTESGLAGIIPSQVFSLDVTPTDSDDQTSLSSEQTTRIHPRSRNPGHIPRPRNAFIIFRSKFVKGPNEGEEKQQNLSKQAGLVWGTYTKEEKAPFEKQAKEEKRIHAAKYPDYVYSPHGKSKCKTKKSKAHAKSRAVSSPRKNRSTFSQIKRSPPLRSSASTFDAYIPRTERVSRAAARRAVERIIRTLTPSPESSPALSSSDEDEFVPSSEIPDLQLSPYGQHDEVEPGYDLSHPDLLFHQTFLVNHENSQPIGITPPFTDDESSVNVSSTMAYTLPECDLISKTLASLGLSDLDGASTDLASSQGPYYNALGEIIVPDVPHVPKEEEDWTTDGEMLAAMSYPNIDGCASMSDPLSF